MNNENNNATTGGCGIGFCGLLTIVFIVLKLTHVIDWNWFWVLSPAIFGTAITVLIIVIALIVLILLKK